MAFTPALIPRAIFGQVRGPDDVLHPQQIGYRWERFDSERNPEQQEAFERLGEAFERRVDERGP